MRIRTLGASAEVLALNGDIDGAAEAMDRALRIAHGTTGPRERIRSLIAVAEGMAVVCPVDQALRAANAIGRTEDRIGALGSVAGALARAGRPGRAVLASVDDGDLSPTGLRALAGALVMAGDVDRAVTVAGRDPDPSWGWDAFVRSLIRAGRLDQARATARFLVTDRLRRGIALLLVAEALAESRRGAEALEVAEHIAEPSDRSRALRAAALAMDDPDRAAELLHRAQTVARAITYPNAPQGELRALALAWAERGELDRALAAVDAIEGNGWRGAARVALARLLVQLGRSDQAAEVLDGVPAPADPDSDLPADVAATLAQAGRLDRAVALARAITDRFRREQALARVARSMAEAGHAVRAGEVLDEAAAAALAVHGADDMRHIYGLVELADAMVHAGRRERAGELLHRAEQLVHTLYAEQERHEAWRLLAGALGRAGLLDRADAIAAGRWPSPWPDLVRALCDVGAFDQAQERAPMIPDPDRRAWALQRVAAGHAQAGRLDEAESVARSIEEAAPRAKALLAVAEARTRAGDLNRALALLRQAETAARAVADSRDHDRLLRDLVESLLAVGRLDQAAEVLGQAEAAASGTPGALAEVLVASGRLDRAFQVALEVADPLEQCGTVASVGEAYAAAGARPETVSQVLLHANAISASVTGPEPRIRLLARLARAWAVTGDVRQADRTIKRLAAEGVPLPGQAAVDVAEALSAMGRHDHALGLAADCADSQVAATAAVAVSLARAGDLTRALGLARSLPDPELREWALAEVSRAVARSGDPDRALRLIRPGHADDGGR